MQQVGQSVLYRERDCQQERTGCKWRAVDALSGSELWLHDDDPLLNGLGWAAQWQHDNYTLLTQQLPPRSSPQFNVPELAHNSITC